MKSTKQYGAKRMVDYKRGDLVEDESGKVYMITAKDPGYNYKYFSITVHCTDSSLIGQSQDIDATKVWPFTGIITLDNRNT